MMSSMMSLLSLSLAGLILQLLVTEVKGGAELQLQMISYENSNAKDWDDSCCDQWCWSDCDHIFTFSLDLSNGNDDSKTYYYWTRKTGTFSNQNSNRFGPDMNGVTNPILTVFTPRWTGAVKFKVYVEDDDSPYTGNDPVDGFVQLLQLTPAASQSSSSWTSMTMRGVRPSHKTSLVLNYRLYCQPNFYSSDCSVYCVASDSSAGHYTCDPTTGSIVCRSGWRDPTTQCTKSSDNCIGNQCRNGATCVNGRDSYTCACAQGYTGMYCEVNINECASNPCQNSGTCSDLVAGYQCTCSAAFVGVTCSQPFCQFNNRCKNGGTCYGSGQCRCPTGFLGSDCSINRCDNVVCSNGGTCFNGTCFCPESFTGPSCNLIQCTGRFYCLNNGSCFNGTCRCQAGFTGVHCETNIDECSSSPCQNGGTCMDLPAGYRCICPLDYVGVTCSRPYCQENNPCRNGGTCIGAGMCLCPSRFTGLHCSVDRCDLITCRNGGNCSENGTCSCPEGFVGQTCDLEKCSMMPCLNGGTCKKSQCICRAGYTGQYCEVNIDDCVHSPCRHDGTCYDQVNGFTCRCQPDWTGSDCSIPVQPLNQSVNASSSSVLLIADQPSGRINPMEAWFYASFVIIFLLLIIVLILSICLCCLRRRQRRTDSVAVDNSAPVRVEAVENKYAKPSLDDDSVFIDKPGCSSTDKSEDLYQHIYEPPSPPPRYSTTEDIKTSPVVSSEYEDISAQ